MKSVSFQQRASKSLMSLVSDSKTSSIRRVLVLGPRGIGKSTLIDHLLLPRYVGRKVSVCESDEKAREWPAQADEDNSAITIFQAQYELDVPRVKAKESKGSTWAPADLLFVALHISSMTEIKRLKKRGIVLPTSAGKETLGWFAEFVPSSAPDAPWKFVGSIKVGSAQLLIGSEEMRDALRMLKVSVSKDEE